MTITVLVIDDNPDIVQSMAELLELLGYRVWAFTKGAQAIAAAETLHPNLALIDLGMPEMDGFEVARRLREISPRTTLMACSAWGDSYTRSLTQEAGFAHHLQKPLDLHRLEAMLKHYDSAA